MSLRDQNRRASLRVIQSAALRLFERNGFDAVTVEDVAREAEVSASTVYRAFGRKEELVVFDEGDVRVEEGLQRMLGTAPPLVALELAFTEAYTLPKDEAEALRARAALIDRTPVLAAYQLARLHDQRRALVSALARAHGKPTQPLEYELTVRVALEALLAAFEAWLPGRPQRSLHGWIAAAFSAARVAAAREEPRGTAAVARSQRR